MTQLNAVHQQDEQTKEKFTSALVGFISSAIVFCLGSLLLYWPYPARDPLWVTSYDTDKGARTTLSTEDLPVFTKALAWAEHLLPILTITLFCILMACICNAFNKRHRFTEKSIRYFATIRWVLISGLGIYWLAGIVLAGQVRNFYTDLPHVTVNQDWANQPIMYGFIMLLVVYFIEGALRRGLGLQEDVDATI